jgi:hypothetical protein
MAKRLGDLMKKCTYCDEIFDIDYPEYEDTGLHESCFDDSFEDSMRLDEIEDNYENEEYEDNEEDEEYENLEEDEEE